MRRIRKDDEVVVIAGKDKGRRGKVTRVVDGERVIVAGVNMIKRHTKPNPARNVAGGIIQREAHSYRYRLTALGLRTALFWTRSYARLLRTGMSELQTHNAGNSQLCRAFAAFERAVESKVHDLKLAS